MRAGHVRHVQGEAAATTEVQGQEALPRLPLPHSSHSQPLQPTHPPALRCLSALPRLRPAWRSPYRAHTRRKSAAAAMHTRCRASLVSSPSSYA